MADIFEKVCSATDASRGVYSRLQDDQRPLRGRIELCIEVLHDPELFLPNKNQVLADWLCKQLATVSGDDNRQNRANLWQLLGEALKSRDGEQTTLRQHFLQIVLKEFKNIKTHFGNGEVARDMKVEMSIAYVDAVFTCVTDVVKSPYICPLWLGRLENISEIFKECLECYLVIFHARKDIKMDGILNFLNALSTRYAGVIQRQDDQRNVFESFCKPLLPLLLFVRNDVILHRPSEAIKELTRHIDLITAACLFHRDHLPKYKTQPIKVSEEPSPKKARGSNYTELLFNTLKNPVEISLHYDFPPEQGFHKIWTETISVSLPFILETFLDSLKDDTKFGSTTKFTFFTRLYDILDEYKPSPRLQVLAEMLGILCKFDVYQVAEDNVNGQLIYKWLTKLTKGILLTNEVKSSLCGCLSVILKLNHKQIEDHLEEVLSTCFTSECEGAAGLLCDIIKTYTKLQQVELLVKSVLNVGKKPGKSCGSLPAECLTELSFAFQQCPVSLSCNLFKVFLDETKSLVDVLVSKQLGTKDGTALEMVVTVFVTFLVNSSFNATDPHGLDATKTTTLNQYLNRTHTEILQPLMDSTPTLENTCQKHVMFSTLHLLHGTNVVNGYLNRHGIFTNADVVLPDVVWNGELGVFSVSETWDGLEYCEDDAQIRLCMVKFVVQRARQLLAEGETDREGLKRCVDFLFSHKKLKCIRKVHDESWNGDVGSVTAQNFPVAFWHTLTTHATLFLPHCDKKQVDRFAECFIRTLTFSTKSAQDEPLTVVGISRELLSNGDLLVLAFAQEAIVAKFWQVVGKSAGKITSKSKILDIFGWTTASTEVRNEEQNGVSDTHDSEIPKQESEMTVENRDVSERAEMEKAMLLSTKLAKVMKAKSEKSKAKGLADDVRSNVEDIMKLLRVLDELPCVMFTPVVQSRCLLGLLVCDVLLGKPYSKECLKLQLSCRTILCRLLDEWLVHREYRTWKLVNMENFLGWLLSTVVSEEVITGPNFDTEAHFHITVKILQSSTLLAVRSRKRENLPAVAEFVGRLIGLLDDQLKPDHERVPKLLLSVISACTQLLQEKLLSKAASRVLPDLISTAMLSLKDRFASFFEINGSQKTAVYVVVLQLAAELTKGVSLGLRPGYPRSENVSKAIQDWSDLVSTLYERTRDALTTSVAVGDGQVSVYNCIMEDLSQCVHEHRTNLPKDFEEEVFGLGLDALWKSGLSYEDIVLNGECGTDEFVGSSLRLLSAVVQMGDGTKCASLLASLGEIRDPPAKALVGYSVMKYLLAKKVAKKRKGDIRARFANVLVSLLSDADGNLESLVLVLEIVAAVLCLGNDAVFSQDLNIVFQALACVRDVRMGERPELFQRLFAARFQILSLTLFNHKDYVYGVIHLFLNGTTDLLNSLLSTEFMESSAVLQSCAQKMSRLFQEMTSHKEVLSKYAVHFVSTCIHLLSTRGIPGPIRDILIEGVHCLLDICKEDTLTKIHVYLPNSERELFKTLKEDYRKHHKFKGNA